MVKKSLTNLRDWVDDKLRYACGSLSKDARIIIIITFILGGSILSIYWTVSSIYNMGTLGTGTERQYKPLSITKIWNRIRI